MPDSSGLGNDGPESHSDSPRIKLNSCLEETSQLVVGGKQTDCLWLIGTTELTQALGKRWEQDGDRRSLTEITEELCPRIARTPDEGPAPSSPSSPCVFLSQLRKTEPSTGREMVHLPLACWANVAWSTTASWSDLHLDQLR